MKNKTCRNQESPALKQGPACPVGRGKGGFSDVQNGPLLYYKTREEIESYRKKPVKLKLQWLQAQMEFFHKAMPEKAKKIRDRLRKGEL
ncbi:MAG: hypothetical protein AB1632_02875 [Nitrospirota bacterium]